MKSVILFFLTMSAWSLCVGQVSAQALSKGDTAVLTQDSVLYFQDVGFKLAKKGETFSVISYSPSTNKVFVAAKDVVGKSIALSVASSNVTKQTVTNSSTTSDSEAATKSIRRATVDEAALLVTTDIARGSAFLVQMNGKNYIVTNYHVVKGAKTISFSNSKAKFSPSQLTIEVADDRDLVRFPTDLDYGLEVAKTVAQGKPVSAYGNSGGKDVITKLDGSVLGVGPDEIEVSCNFIMGNSGGPIIDDKGDVVGIATYVATESGIPDWVKKGTRFAETRRFGVRLLDGIKWSSTSLPSFQSETKTLESMNGMLDDYLTIVLSMARAPFQKSVETEYAKDQAVTNVVAAYNLGCREHEATIGTSADDILVDKTNRKFHGKARTILSDLSRAITANAKDFTFRNQNFTTPKTRNENKKLIKEMEDWADFLQARSSAMSPAHLFQLTEPSTTN